MAGMPEMQEQFSAGAYMARNAETKEKFPATPSASRLDARYAMLVARIA